MEEAANSGYAGICVEYASKFSPLPSSEGTRGLTHRLPTSRWVRDAPKGRNSLALLPYPAHKLLWPDRSPQQGLSDGSALTTAATGDSYYPAQSHTLRAQHPLPSPPPERGTHRCLVHLNQLRISVHRV